jgi:hypothetical protein
MAAGHGFMQTASPRLIFPIDSFPVRRREPLARKALEGYILVLDEFTQPYQLPYRVMVPQRRWASSAGGGFCHACCILDHSNGTDMDGAGAGRRDSREPGDRDRLSTASNERG